jgi:hypothetical protein
MGYAVWLTLAVVALFAAAAWLAIWSRRDTWARPVAVVLFLAAMPTIALAAVESLGWHRPIALVWDLDQGEYRVLAAKMVQDKAIYIYIDDEARVEPRPLLLPWDNDTANAIQRALDGAPDGSEGEFMMSYEPSIDMTGQQFHAVPPEPAPPPKDVPQPALTYEHG